MFEQTFTYGENKFLWDNTKWYRFGFNGKEKIDEINNITGATYDYGFRVYDCRIGRFLSIDPLIWKFPFYSPYQFASNSPIVSIDIEGLESTFRLNYNEGSVEIIDSKMQSTQLKNIDKNRWYFATPWAPTQPSEGNPVKVWCEGCVGGAGWNPQDQNSGSWININVGKIQITTTKTIERVITETIPGTPGTNPTYKTTHASTSWLSGSYTYNNGGNKPVKDITTNEAINLAISTALYRVNTANNVGASDPKVNSKITSIDITFNKEYSGDKNAVISALRNAYSVNVNSNVGTVGATAGNFAAFDIKVNYDVITKTSEGTPSIPDKTETKTETETITTTSNPIEY